MPLHSLVRQIWRPAPWVMALLLAPDAHAVPPVPVRLTPPPAHARATDRRGHAPPRTRAVVRNRSRVAHVPNRIKRMFYFEPHGITISAKDTAALREIAEALHQEFPTSVFIVRGYADAGEFQRNINLPEQRARAIAGRLVRHGIAAEQLKTEGEKPFVTDAAGRRLLAHVDTLRRAELYRTGNHIMSTGSAAGRNGQRP